MSRTSLYDRGHFAIIRFVHETLYGIFVDPYGALASSGISAGQKVLEVGSGPGFFTIPAAELVGEGGRVYAIDNNPAAVDYLTRKVSLRGVKNVEVMLADAKHTGIAAESLDVVFLYGVIHDVWDEVEAVIAEAHRTLKPSGILSVSKSPVPEAKVIEAIVGGGRFSLVQKTHWGLNFERV